MTDPNRALEDLYTELEDTIDEDILVARYRRQLDNATTVKDVQICQQMVFKHWYKKEHTKYEGPLYNLHLKCNSRLEEVMNTKLLLPGTQVIVVMQDNLPLCITQTIQEAHEAIQKHIMEEVLSQSGDDAVYVSKASYQIRQTYIGLTGSN